MVWEALGSVIVGLAIALAATRRLPGRFPARTLTLATGPAAALLGAFLAHSILGPGHFFQTLLAAACLGAAMLSLLIRPAHRLSPLRSGV
ncbi:hypothetical protein OEIGOIKO_02798 [Streptomyces chrestomyceticus JCM 4735]|uniref:Integral membrane protein n=3 Tax=Streptomyces TaxID=1883 RepID=A0A401W1L8_STREY|nr:MULTISPECIES: hypothetical protein [Streptomyces]GCD35055.1 hypothetical protein OEIGOIKO_02798 [Streptomyces chrestomyceticus JCM 4735]GCD43207.1 hypothetical protein GKJPGBOP_02887 [Streptomyces paromomycinus]